MTEHVPVRGWRGHPAGLAILAATEVAERFSYYGMTALLALYLNKQLLTPGHAEHVAGLAALRHLFEFRGPMSNAAFGSLIYGWYGGLVYFTPILGGILADRLLGIRRTVILGALLMSAGHLAMAFDSTFLGALVLLILGSGALKGNISAQVGTLYPANSESLRARGFTIFSTAINIGSVLGPLATGTAAAVYGWHIGFAVAAGLMLIALGIYLAGQPLLPKPKAARRDRPELPPLSQLERRRTLGLILIIILAIPQQITYTMIWNIGIVWIDQHVSLASPLGNVPASLFNSVDAFGSILAAAPLVALWSWQARRRREPSNISKVAIGHAIMGASAFFFVAGILLAGPGEKVSVLWAIAGFLGMGTAFMWNWPVLLALVSQLAPAKINSTLMGASFLALFAGTVIMGWVGSFYDQMSNAAFWTLDAMFGLGGALAMALMHRTLKRLLAPPQDQSITG